MQILGVCGDMHVMHVAVFTKLQCLGERCPCHGLHHGRLMLNTLPHVLSELDCGHCAGASTSS